jgi:hypothetical protein
MKHPAARLWHKIPLAAALAAAIGAPADAQQIATVTPVFGQIVAYDLPAGFVPVFEDANDSGYIQESVLQGETLQDWSQMITLTGAKGAAGMTAEGVAQSIASGFAAACPDSLSAIMLNDLAVPGAQAGVAVFLGCGTVADPLRSEVMLMLVAIGATDAYTLQWAARGPAMAGPPEFDPALWDARLQVMSGGLRLCARVAGEAPPYASCVE